MQTMVEIPKTEEQIRSAWGMGFKSTKQESIIDQIRDEIQENINYNKKMNYQGIVAGLLLTLDIIDKYRASTGYRVESEASDEVQ